MPKLERSAFESTLSDVEDHDEQGNNFNAEFKNHRDSSFLPSPRRGRGKCRVAPQPLSTAAPQSRGARSQGRVAPTARDPASPKGQRPPFSPTRTTRAPGPRPARRVPQPPAPNCTAFPRRSPSQPRTEKQVGRPAGWLGNPLSVL